MFNIFEDQFVNDVVLRAEQFRSSYTLQNEEFHNLNSNLHTYLNDIKRIDNDNRQLQENIDEIRTNYIIILENHLERLPKDFRQESHILTEAHIERYKSKSRARRFINEREELKKRINFLSNNEKDQIKRLNNLENYEKKIANEFKILNEQLQNVYHYVQTEKQIHQQSMNKIDDLQIQLEDICIQRSKTEFEIQTLREEVKLMRTAKEFLDEEHETILSTQTEANEYLLSRLNESILHIREDFNELNKGQIKQIENEYKQMMKILEENTLVKETIEETMINQQRKMKIEYENLENEHQSMTKELKTLNDHNQILSEKILNMELDLYSIRNEHMIELTNKDNEFDRSQIELQTLNERLNHLAEYDRNLKFELTLYRGVLESEYRRKQQQLNNNQQPLVRPNILRITTNKNNKNSSKNLINRNQFEPIIEKTDTQSNEIISSINQPVDDDEKIENKDPVQEQPQQETGTETTKSPVSIVPEDQLSSFEVQQASVISSSNQETPLTSSVLQPDLSNSLDKRQILSETENVSTSSMDSTIPEDQPPSSDIRQTVTEPTKIEQSSESTTVNEEEPLISESPGSLEDPQTSKDIQPLSCILPTTEIQPLSCILPTTDREISSETQDSPTTPTVSEDRQESSKDDQTLSLVHPPKDPEVLSETQDSSTTPTVSEDQQESSKDDQTLSLVHPPKDREVLSETQDSSTTPAVSEDQQESSKDNQTLSLVHPPTDPEVLSETQDSSTTPAVSEGQQESSKDDQTLSLVHPPTDPEVLSETQDSSTTPTVPKDQQSSSTQLEDREESSNIQKLSHVSPNEQSIPVQSSSMPSEEDNQSISSDIQQEVLTPSQEQPTLSETEQSSFVIADEYETTTSIKNADSKDQLTEISDGYDNVAEDEFANDQRQSTHSGEFSIAENDSTLEQDQTTTEEPISSSNKIQVKQENTIDHISSPGFYSTINETNHLIDQESRIQTSSKTSLTDIDVNNTDLTGEVALTASPKVEETDLIDDNNLSNLESVVQDLRYVYCILANDDDLVEINDDFPDNLIARLEFDDNLIRTLFDSLLRKYIVQPMKTKDRSKTLDWIEFRDILFPILTGRYTEGHIRKLFDLFDINQTDYLSTKELTELLELLQINNSNELAENMTQENGKLNIDELIETIRTTDDVNNNLLSEDIESKHWYIQHPSDNELNDISSISLEVPSLQSPSKIQNDIILLSRIFRRVGADFDNRQLDSNKPTLSMKLTNEFIHNNIHISKDDLQLFIELYLHKKQTSNNLINWIEFRDVFLPLINGGMVSKEDLTRWFDILHTNSDQTISFEQILLLLRLLQVSNPQEILNRIYEILPEKHNDNSWTISELIFALENIDETTTRLLSTNEHIASFDLEWLKKNIF